MLPVTLWGAGCRRSEFAGDLHYFAGHAGELVRNITGRGKHLGNIDQAGKTGSSMKYMAMRTAHGRVV